MGSQARLGLKRRRKKVSRTEVTGSSSDSEAESANRDVRQKLKQDASAGRPGVTATEEFNNTPVVAKLTDEDIATFGRYYMKKVTEEFAEDLDRIRRADDFHGGALELLVKALQDGTAVFATEDQRRIVLSTRNSQNI